MLSSRKSEKFYNQKDCVYEDVTIRGVKLARTRWKVV